MNSVSVGQIWSLISFGSKRYEFMVDGFEMKGERRAVGVILEPRLPAGVKHRVIKSAYPKPHSVPVKVLERGRRGAHLVRNADGSLAELPKFDRAPLLADKSEGVSASQLVREYKPRGLAKCPPNAMKALALKKQGWTIERLMSHFGKSKGTVNGWLRAARDVEDEERNRKSA